MNDVFRPARLNVKMLIILGLVGAMLLGGAAAGYKLRKQFVAKRALAAGLAAYQQKNWAEACKQLKQYVVRYPDGSPDALAKYAEANLRVRPAKPESVRTAIGAYRRLARLKPDDEHVYKELAKLYLPSREPGQLAEAVHFCDQRLERAPDDQEARLLKAKALVNQRNFADALNELAELVRAQPGKPDTYVLLCTTLLEDNTPDIKTACARILASPGGTAAQPASQPASAADTQPAHRLARQALDLGLARHPDSALLLLHRGRFRRTVETDPVGGQSDLDAADKLKPMDPSVLLALFDEWLAQNAPDRAAIELTALEQLDAPTLDRYDTAAEDLKLPRFVDAGKLAIVKGAKTECVAVADRGLKELADEARLSYMPTAISLYVVGEQVDAARNCVEDYRRAVNELTGRIRASQDLSDQVTSLDAIVAQAEKRPYKVIELLEPLAERRPDVKDIRLRLIGAYETTGQIRRAIRALEECLKRWPGDAKLASNLAERLSGLLASQARWNDAAKYADLAVSTTRPSLTSSPKANLLRLYARVEAFRAGPTDRTVADALNRDITAMIDANPRVVNLRMLQAGITLRVGRTADAAAQLEKAVRECDRPLSAVEMLASLYGQQKQHDKAIQVCADAVKKHTDLAAPRIALARAQIDAGHKDKARATLEEAAASLTGYEKTKASAALTQYFLAQGERPRGIQLLQRLAVDRPDDLATRRLLLRIPEILADAKQSQTLIDELKAVEGSGGVQWRAEQVRVWLAAAERLNPDQRKQELATRESQITEMLNHCIEADPGWPEPVTLLGTFHEMLGRYGQAEAAYRRLLQAEPTEPAVVSQLVQLLLRQGRYTQASEMLKQVPEYLRTSMTPFKRQAIDIAIGTRDRPSAIKETESLVAADPTNWASRILLARLAYADTKDTQRAMNLLDEAQKIAPDSSDPAYAKAQILWADGRKSEALAVLDAEVGRRDDFAARSARAQFREAAEMWDQAEADFKHLTRFKDYSATGYVLLGSFYARRGDTDKATTTWEAGLKAIPDSPELRRALVGGLVSRRDPASRTRSKEMLEDLIKQFPDDTDLRAMRAALLMTEPKPASLADARSDMKQTLERAIQANPGNVNAYRQLIQIARGRGDLAEADRLISQALGTNPGNAGLILAQADLEVERDNLTAARGLAQSVMKADPGNHAARGFVIELALRERNFAEARLLSEQAIKANPNDETLRMGQSRILDAEGKRAEAIVYLASFCRGDAGRKALAARLYLAYLQRLAGDFDASTTTLDEVEKITPGLPIVTIERLNLFGARGQFDRVAAMTAEHRAKHPDDPQLPMAGAMILASSPNAPDRQTARRLLEQLAAAFPNLAELHGSLGLVAYQAGDKKACIAAYRRVLEINPDHAGTLNDLAWILGVEEGRLDEALELANKGVARFPKNPHLLDTRGALLLQLKRFEDARKDLERCVELPRTPPQTKAHASIRLARAYLNLGQAAAAKTQLAHANDIDKTYKVLSDADRAEIEKLRTEVERLIAPQQSARG